MTRSNIREKRDAFKDLLKYVPEDTVKRAQVNCALAEYQESLRKRAEAQLALRLEPLTTENVDVEMARINAEDARQHALDYTEKERVPGQRTRR